MDIAPGECILVSTNHLLDPVEIALEKYKYHPSIQKIKEKVKQDSSFDFQPVTMKAVIDELSNLNPKKASTVKSIPARILKCRILILLTKNKFIGPLKQVKLGDNDIKFVEKSKCLGMMIDSQLSWKLQIEKVKTDMSCKIKKLKLMRYLPKEVLSSVYFKAILPAVIYGISVWGSNSSSKMNELESCHIRAARIINKVPKSVNNADVLTTVKWKDLS